MEYEEPGKWGESHKIALILAIFEVDVVHRSTIRAMLPMGIRRHRSYRAQERAFTLGRTYASSMMNMTSKRFQDALRRFENHGWIVRGEEYILIRDRRGLLGWATEAVPPARLEVEVEAAISIIETEILGTSNEKAIEQRRKEILAIRRLMTNGFGSANWSGSRSVRFVPRSKEL